MCYFNSLSLSEDEQLCDTLSIKPPQPQADFSGEDKARRHKEQSSTYIQSLSHRGSGRAIKSSVSKDGKKDTHNTDGKDRHDSKYEDRHVKDSRKEDLRERLERDRRSRKNKDMDVYYENRDSDGKRQHDVRGARRNERKLKPDDAKFDDKLEFKDHGYKEISKRKKQQTERNIIISSPEEVQIKIESKKMSKENILASKILSEESTDDGKTELSKCYLDQIELRNILFSLDSSSSSKSSSVHNEGSSIVGENEKLSSPHSLHEDREEPEEKRRKSESGSIEEFSRTEITHTSLNVPEPKEELPPYLPAIMGCRSVGEFQCLNKSVKRDCQNIAVFAHAIFCF